eukprot:14296038-Alexandrium_andersonii.AAC.1
MLGGRGRGALPGRGRGGHRRRENRQGRADGPAEAGMLRGLLAGWGAQPSRQPLGRAFARLLLQAGPAGASE